MGHVFVAADAVTVGKADLDGGGMSRRIAGVERREAWNNAYAEDDQLESGEGDDLADQVLQLGDLPLAALTHLLGFGQKALSNRYRYWAHGAGFGLPNLANLFCSRPPSRMWTCGNMGASPRLREALGRDNG